MRLVLLSAIALLLLTAPLPARSMRATVEPDDLFHDAMNIRWDWDTNTLYYSQLAPDGYWHIWSCSYNPESGAVSNIKALTYQNPRVPGRNCGAHTLSRDGKYLIFVAEKFDHPCPWGRNFSQLEPNSFPLGCSYPCTPGFGQFNDLWAMRVDGSETWLLHALPNVTDNYATLLPQLSHDGSKLTWGQRYAIGKEKVDSGGLYQIMIADWTVDSNGVPSLANLQSFVPGDRESFFEVSGWTADDSKIMLTSNYVSRDFGRNQLFFLDVATREMSEPFTPNTSYSEHPHLTPHGRIVYMTTEGDNTYTGTDWWIMDADGSNRQQLTYMNRFPDPMVNIFGASVVCGDNYAWSPDGSFFLGTIQTNILTQTGLTRRVHFPPTRFAQDWFVQGESAYTTWTPATGEWKVSDGKSPARTYTASLGSANDVPLRAHWNGSRVATASVWSPATASFESGGASPSLQVGQSGDVPVPADYDGDGKTDAIVYRPATGEWFGRLSGLGNSFGDRVLTFGGQSGDIPFACDFDGDRRADMGIYRDGNWAILLSSRQCDSNSALVFKLGNASASQLPVPSDYTGYGVCSPAVFDNSTGWWQWRPNSGKLQFGELRTRQWGSSSNVPVVDLDIDGDGRTELSAVSTGGYWMQQPSASNYSEWFLGTQKQWGARGDIFLPLHPAGVRARAMAVPAPAEPSPVPGSPVAHPVANGPHSCFSSTSGPTGGATTGSSTSPSATSAPTPTTSDGSKAHAAFEVVALALLAVGLNA